MTVTKQNARSQRRAQRAADAQTPAKSPAAYHPTEADRQAAADFLARKEGKPQLAGIKVTRNDGVLEIGLQHADQAVALVHLANMLATDDRRLADGLMLQLARSAARNGDLRPADADLALSVVRAIAPRDATEALLAVQMSAIHNATMHAAHYLAGTQTVPQQDSASNMLNKLARTFASQLEALKKWRSTGEQSIKVQHVTVNEGGQAIVGNVAAGGRGKHENERQPHELGADAAASRADAPSPPLLGEVEALGVPMPGAGSARLERVPMPRREGRSANGGGQRPLAARRPNGGGGGAASDGGGIAAQGEGDR